MTRLSTTALSLFVLAAISRPAAVTAEGAALPEHVIFRTSQTVTTGLGGLSAMDARCQAKAAAAGLDGTWMALLSDSAHGARQRLADAGAEGPFYDNCGSCAAGPRRLAESLDDLFDGSVAATLVFDEFGKSVPSTMESWTATLADGSYAGSSYDDWTSFRGAARTGKHAATGSTWLSWVERTGVASHSLYCVRTGLEPAAPPPAEPQHVHTIFVSSALYDGNLGGLAGADAECRRLAVAAGWEDRTWRAVLSDSETDARDRLGIVGPVVNTRGRLVADDFEDLFDGGSAAFVRFDENGNLWNDQLVWTGSHPDGSRYRAGGPAAYKQDWTSSTGTVAVGGTLRKDAGWLEWRRSAEHGTAAPARLYCVDSVERRVELAPFPLMAINTLADDICTLGPGGACEADGAVTVRPPARLFDVFQYATGMVVDQAIADRGYPYDEVFHLGRADELVDRLELCGDDCRDAGVVVRVPHCFAGGWSVDPDLGLRIPDCAEAFALDDAAANAYRERWWRPRFEDAVRRYGPASQRGGRIVGWSVAEERAMAATFWIDYNDWGYPLLARARTALDRQDPWSRPLLNFLPNNSAPGLSIPLQLVYGKAARCDDSVHDPEQLQTDLGPYLTWPLLDGYAEEDLVAFDLFPGDSAEAPAGVREVTGGSHTAGYRFPTCFAADAAGQPLALTRHLIVGNYVSSVLSAFEADGRPYGDRNRIWGYHQSESAVEARDVTRQLFESRQWDLPANLVVHAIEMSWGCDGGRWLPRPDSEEHARHDFWVGLHLGQGVYLYNLRYRSESPAPGPGDACAPREPLTHPAWRVSDADFPDGPYPVGLHLLKHGSPPPGFGDGAFEPVAPMREALATWRRDPQEVAAACNFLQAEELPGSGVAAVGEVIDEGPAAEADNYGVRGYVDPYPALHCTVWEAPDRDRLWIVATNSFAQRTQYEIVLPRPYRRLDTPANPGLSQSVTCAPEPRGEVCKVWLDGIDAHVVYVELTAG